MTIDQGDLYRLTYVHRDPAGTPVNAGTMTLTITLPDGTATAPVTVAPAFTGNYSFDYQTTVAGLHQARWLGTGANPGSHSEAFDVVPPSAGYLISPDDARKALSSTDAGAAAMKAHDDELRLWVAAATGVIERHLNEVVARRSITELHQLRYARPELALRRGPVISLTSLATTDGTLTWDVTSGPPSGVQLDTDTGVVSAERGPWFCGHLRAVYVAGYQVVPAHYLGAVRITLQHLWSSQRGSRGAPRMGGTAVMETLPIPGMGFALPRMAIELLGPGIPGIA